MTRTELERCIAGGGVVRGPLPSRREFLRAAEALGFAPFTVDCGGADTKEALLQRFAESLRFPEHFGMNLDALHDSLTDLVMAGPRQGTALLLEHFEAGGKGAGQARPRAAARAVLEVLEGAVRSLAEGKLRLTVLVG
jgi:RNAse (barnase) inhibitor barstar